jgi:hypothetical protein
MDKSVFHGTSPERLIQFVGEYNVLLPNTLGIECIISDEEDGKKPSKNPSRLLDKLCILIRNGAYSGRSMGSMINRERESHKITDCIIDHENTKLIREGKINLDPSFIESEAEIAKEAFLPMIDFCKKMATTTYESLVKKNLQKSFRQQCNQTDPENRLKNWIQAADKLRERILNDQLSLPSFYITDRNDKWLNWQLLRIYFAWAMEWACRRNASDSAMNNTDISNDFYDMEYVVYLNNADGILSRDGNLVLPLSKAAFPEKDVFSCLDDVTEEYRC